MTSARSLIDQMAAKLGGKGKAQRRERLIGWLAETRLVSWLLERPETVARLAAKLGRYRWLLRPVCCRRARCKGTWAEGVSTCSTCGAQAKRSAPPGTLLADEKDRSVYQVEDNGSTLRRIDKYRGSKKDRRRNREAVKAAAAVRERLTVGSDDDVA